MSEQNPETTASTKHLLELRSLYPGLEENLEYTQQQLTTPFSKKIGLRVLAALNSYGNSLYPVYPFTYRRPR